MIQVVENGDLYWFRGHVGRVLKPDLLIANPGASREFIGTYFVLDFSQKFLKFLWMIVVHLNITISQLVINVNHPKRFFVTYFS